MVAGSLARPHHPAAGVSVGQLADRLGYARPQVPLLKFNENNSHFFVLRSTTTIYGNGYMLNKLHRSGNAQQEVGPDTLNLCYRN